MDSLNKNELFLITEKLSLKDCFNLSLTCKNFYNKIWELEEFWVFKFPQVNYAAFNKLNKKNLVGVYFLLLRLEKIAEKFSKIDRT